MNAWFRVRRNVLVSILAAVISSSGSALAQEHYSLSVVPQLPRLVLHDDWQPLLEYLNDKTGAEFVLSLQDSIPLFELDFLEGNPDFVFLNPYHAVMAHKAHDYEPILSDGSRQLKGILVVPVASDIESVEDLDGKTVAFPAPNAFGASLYMRALLANDFGINITASYVGTHANAYRHALLGEAAAGGGVNNTLRKESEDFQAALRILYETPGVTPHPLAVHPRVPADIRNAVITAILELSETEAGRAMLKAVQLEEPMKVSYAGQYEILEGFHLEDFVVVAD